MRIIFSISILTLFLLPACSINEETQDNESHSSVEWADVVKWENTIYYHDETKTDEFTEQDLGEELGEVTFRVMYSDEGSNPDYQLKNGEATWLDEGTTIHTVNGESTADYIFADGKVYKADK